MDGAVINRELSIKKKPRLNERSCTAVVLDSNCIC